MMKNNHTLTYLFAILVIGSLSFMDSFAQKKISEVSTFYLTEDGNPNIKITFSINTSKKEINFTYDNGPVKKLQYYDYNRIGDLGFFLSLRSDVKAPVDDTQFKESEYCIYISTKAILTKLNRDEVIVWNMSMDTKNKMEQYADLFINLLGLKPQEKGTMPSSSATSKSNPPARNNTQAKNTSTNKPAPAPKKRVVKYISTKDIIEKPFCCVNGTWESISIQNLHSQLKANGYSQPDKLDDSYYYYLHDMESHIHDIIIDNCSTNFDENGNLTRYSAGYLGDKYSREQMRKAVELIQEDIKKMGALIRFESKGSGMLAYYKDKEINLDLRCVSDNYYSLDITIFKDPNPINKTIFPKEFTMEELLTLPFGFIKSKNQEEILKVLRTNKWKIESSSIRISSTEKGYSMFGIPIKRFSSFFVTDEISSFSFHGSEPLTSNQGEKYLRVYSQLQAEFKTMGAKLTTIQKKKNWKKFKAELKDRDVVVTYNSSNEAVGYELSFDVNLK